jgi:alpha-L-arabinofuranosidase
MQTSLNRIATSVVAVAALTIMAGPRSAVADGTAPVSLTVQANQPGAKINPAMWGIFFEDINLGADGGLYAELVKNRSFEFPDAMMGWLPSVRIQEAWPSSLNPMSESGAGSLEIHTDNPFDPQNPHYLRITSQNDHGSAAVNEGFRGIGIRAGERYDFSAQIRAGSGPGIVRVELLGAGGTVIGSATIKGIGPEWKQHKASLTAKDTAAKGKLRIIAEGNCVVDFDMVSLFPQKTWKNRPGGLRADMVQMLADLKPGFLRFPGGCIVEGSQLDRRYQWKTTIGPIADRKLIVNRWNYEFKHRLTPDYYQSFGLGFYEFFQLCEDIGASPLPIINCGMACQFNTGQLVSLDQLDPYIQDDLDLIEFANGDVKTEWGAKRAALGHPAPFNLKMIGIGNEQWGPQYIERLARFQKALKEKHPEISLVTAAGPSPADDRFEFLWPKLRELNVDIVDEHCYANPIWFLANSHRYDHYDRQGPKVFMGEYAAQSVKIVSVDNRNNLECALAEAAYMTGLERNADVVRMASYAPLFAHVDGWQWTPNLIWVDNLRIYGTPNYYVQQLFTLNRGDAILPVELNGVETSAAPAGRIGLATYQTSAEFKDVTVTRNGQTLFSSNFETGTSDWSTEEGKWAVNDGAYRQADPGGSGCVVAGDKTWTDYTVSFKARKVAGAEGFMVRVRSDGPENYIAWNLGGFKNTTHALQARLGQQDQLLNTVPGSIEAGRWYDARIELNGTKISCYLDGQLIQTADVPPVKTQQLYASAVRDDKAGEVILKVVNPGQVPRDAKIRLAGLKKVGSSAGVSVLTGERNDDLNSFEQPRRIAPASSKIKLSGSDFDYTFPPRSFTVFRVSGR